jgi:tetratricopeptide (TPR) repeat protein
VSAARSPRLRRILVVLGVWAVVTGVAIAWAAALDDPVGAGARDEAQPAAVGQIADPGGTGTGAGDVAAPKGLPPLALVVDTPLPADLAGLDAGDAALRLRDRVLTGGTAEEWVLLGSLLQQLGRGPMAGGAYRAALELKPDDLAAQVGLALVDGATGSGGAERAAAELRRLAAAHPDSQLVAFNQGWLAAYRRQVAAARAAWQRTVALDPGSRLGQTASTLLDALGHGLAGRNP